jgi:hypothetical protein
MSVRISNANMPAGFQSYRLQYGLRSSPTCGGIATWTDVGAPTSSEIWRGVQATGTADGTALSTNPVTPGDLLLVAVSDVAGRLEHANPSVANPYSVAENEDIEYDWYLEQNGAVPSSIYCFRMIRLDGTALDGYFFHPQIRTAGFSPATRNWRWYTDVENETPTSPLASEDVAPSNIGTNETLALRITVDELKNVIGPNARFELQFSDDSTFFNALPVVATSTCVENSLWCFVDGGGVDNALITTSLLSDSDGCVSGTGNGCGTHHESRTSLTGHTHGAGRAQEYSFAIRQRGARVNAVYYFRLFDLVNGEVVQPAVGEVHPSIVVEGSSLTFSVTGLPAGTTTAGVVTDIETTPTDIGFGSLDFDTTYTAAQRISVTTNATQGYQVFKFTPHPFATAGGSEIPPLPASNATPLAWSLACAATSTGCFGYHTTDATLAGGSGRFSANDTYAGPSLDLDEVMFSSIPTNDTHDIVFRIRVDELQAAGIYETDVIYLAVPVH